MVNQELVSRYIQMNEQANNEIDTMGEVQEATIDELNKMESMLTDDDISYIAMNYLPEYEYDEDDMELYMGGIM